MHSWYTESLTAWHLRREKKKKKKEAFALPLLNKLSEKWSWRATLRSSQNIYPLPQFLLEKQAEQIVGHSKPHWGTYDQHLLQPGRERPLVDKDGKLQ